METIETAPKKSRRPKKSELSHLSEVLQLMKDSGVQKFRYKDVEVEFEVNVRPIQIPITLDDEAERLKKIENLQETLKEDVDEELKDLLWST